MQAICARLAGQLLEVNGSRWVRVQPGWMAVLGVRETWTAP